MILIVDDCLRDGCELERRVWAVLMTLMESELDQ